MQVEELVKEAIENIKACQESDWPKQITELWGDKLFQENVAMVCTTHPIMYIAAISGDSGIAAILRVIMAISFETGRLYGRSEIVRETMGEPQ